MEQPIIHRPAGADRLNQRHRKKSSTASRVTNGALLLPLNHRAWCRRLRDLLEAHVADLGGWDTISNAEMALVRRCATLIVECERRETEFARVGHADDVAFAIYQTAVNTLRRCLESLGLQRRARDVSPTLADIIREAAADREAAARQVAIEADGNAE